MIYQYGCGCGFSRERDSRSTNVHKSVCYQNHLKTAKDQSFYLTNTFTTTSTTVIQIQTITYTTYYTMLFSACLETEYHHHHEDFENLNCIEISLFNRR